MVCDEKMDEIWRLSDTVEHPRLETAEDVREFIRCLTALIYDYKMVGLIYGVYAEDVEYHKQSGIRLFSPDEIVKQVTDFTAAFPDLHAEIENIIVYQQAPDFFKVFRRLRYQGTNLGFSPHGPATGKSLGERCYNLTMMHVKLVQGQWKIVFEVNSDSENLLRQTQTADAEGGAV